ncbi:MAG: hypothetical protein ABGX22_09470 [Pirellulaceae bacterium]
MKPSIFIVSLAWRSGRLLITSLLVMSLLLTSGCGGCNKPKPTAKKAKQQEKEKPKPKKKPFISKRPVVVPSDDEDNGTQLNSLKPGHWTTITQQMISNEADVQVEIRSQVIDQFENGVRIENTAYELVSTRAAAMPKERLREFESLFFVPRSGRRILRNRVVHRRNGATLLNSSRPATPMPAYQCFMVVLSREPDRLKFLKTVASVESLAVYEDGQPPVHYNRVAFLKPKAKFVPLPSHPLTWTSISTVLWDRIDPNLVTPQQQAALVDWLHWGGRLIVNGPGSLERLRGSFLDPYLPADRTEAVELTAESLREFNQQWSVPTTKEKTTIELKPGQVMVAVRLKVKNNGYFVSNSDELLAEGKVGRGSILVTSFSLVDRAVLTWKSFDSFLNGCLLRRPRRKFDVGLVDGGESRLDTELSGQDARLVSNLRYFSRDTPRNQRGRWAADPISGVAGWNDFSGTAEAARNALKEAAGISVPRVDFVMRTLFVYLLVIVPLNWLFFRLIGRVEWAWVAAPLIAVVGSIGVIRVAELDIGFARSRTEIATLELHGGYSRGHLTRYTALYTSLTSQYSMTLDEPTALAQPFASGDSFSLKSYDKIHTVGLKRGRNIKLEGFHVSSNSTSMIHSEQMYELGGPFRFTGDDQKGWSLRNESQTAIKDVGLLWKENEQIQVAWVGDLSAGQVKPIEFGPVTSPQWQISQWGKVRTFQSARDKDDGELRLRDLWAVAVQRLTLEDGEVRMVGWSDAEPPGATFRPAASQTRIQTFVVGHFWPSELKLATHDVNLPPKKDLDSIDILRDEDLLPTGKDIILPPTSSGAVPK